MAVRACGVTAPADVPKPKRQVKIPRWVDPLMFAIGLGLLVYVVSLYPFDDIVDAIARMWPTVALTPFIALAWFYASTTAMYLLLDRRVGWFRVLWIRLVGDSYNVLLPLAGFGGEPFKIRQLSRDVDTSTVMATLIRDRLVDNAIGWLYGGTEIAIGLTAYTVDAALEVPLIGYLVFCVVVGTLGMVLTRTRVPGRLGGWLRTSSAAPRRTASSRCRCAGSSGVLGYLGSRSLGLLEKVVLLWSLGLPHDLVTAAFADGWTSAAGYVGFMIPQGLGIFEGATIKLVNIIGGLGANGVAFAFARRGRMLVVGLFGIMFHVVAVAWRAIRRGAK